MDRAFSNTSPLLYLHRIDKTVLLEKLFGTVTIPVAVVAELFEGGHKGYNVPKPADYPWIKICEPKAMPSEWFAVDLGPGEVVAISLAMDNPGCILLLDDMLARRLAKAAGINVWGTLRVLMEAKAQGFLDCITPEIDKLADAGMWISEEIRLRILSLAGERE